MIRLITEFSMRKQEIEVQLSSAAKQIINHICKLVLMPYNESANHWKREIRSFLNQINTLKGNNKFPSEKQIFNWTYNKYYEWLNSVKYMTLWIDDIIQEYDELQMYTNAEFINYDLIANNINCFCKDYFSWIALKLSKDGFVPLNDIYTELDTLITKYSM